MNIYTSCAGCGHLLHYTDNLDHHNGQPPCQPKRTRIQKLTAQWLEAATAGHDDLADQLEAQIVDLDNRHTPRMLDAATLYAAWGWPVFPLRARDKRPATKHGFKDATTDPARIRDWWTRHPDHNIGLPTGHAFDVIDIDPPAGAITYSRMIADNLLPDIHGQVATSSGGLHLYTKPTGRKNAVDGVGGVDYRGVGGYVVAPPSTCGPGRAWSWITKPSPEIKNLDAATEAAT